MIFFQQGCEAFNMASILQQGKSLVVMFREAFNKISFFFSSPIPINNVDA